MLKTVRYAHLAGLALLLVGVLAPRAVGLVPGLVLAAVSGCFLLFLRSGFLQQRWLQLHLAAAFVVMTVIVVVLLPISLEVAGLAEPGGSEALLARERLWLWVAGALELAVGAIGYLKPMLRAG